MIYRSSHNIRIRKRSSCLNEAASCEKVSRRNLLKRRFLILIDSVYSLPSLSDHYANNENKTRQHSDIKKSPLFKRSLYAKEDRLLLSPSKGCSDATLSSQRCLVGDVLLQTIFLGWPSWVMAYHWLGHNFTQLVRLVITNVDYNQRRSLTYELNNSRFE